MTLPVQIKTVSHRLKQAKGNLPANGKLLKSMYLIDMFSYIIALTIQLLKYGRNLGMITENLNTVKLLEGWFENDPNTRSKSGFPLYKSTGTNNMAVVYFEIEPGNKLGSHTDSAEEIILILEGEAEAIIGDEQGRLSKGELALIPSMIPHAVRNIGSDTLKVIGFFASPNVVSTFAEPLMPLNQTIVGTPQIETEQPLSWNEIFNKLVGEV